MTATDPRLEEIQARLAAATPGPWEAFSSNDDYPPVTHTVVTASHGDTVAALDEVDRATLREGPQATGSQDAWFIANAPADVAYLLAELRKAHEALERVEALCEQTDVESGEPLQAWLVDSIRAAVAAAKGD